ncbi:MAG: Mrp/NBP35 family ATP-binding protein [Methanobacteriaceae archaeon]|jgi:ATP-binding protein involved in chromosome partitioning|uniref:Mrp/NBP35 family ATP-binding protein n=1 Tax=Methanobrevibacter sp. UBA46 TaxID=1915488 RepID=UPI00375D16B2|nr:Mrp/NBP35 family ATP-binding protein [Methanobacteriaceae archaeon]MDD4594131.1 Mrp/NBP35 family ATP-binding protein [Methanobacteriaceae archaeon]
MVEHQHQPQMSEEEQKLRLEQEKNLLENLNHIKYKIVVMSGKGGVGKSTVSANIAEAFQKQGFKTGLLDVDIHGPNIPKIFGTENENIQVEDKKLLPVKSESGIEIMSIAYLLDSNKSAVIWRGPQKTGVIRQFLSDVKWGNLDVLVIDNPPGTGDEPLTVLQSIPLIDGVIMVTTPNTLSKDDVQKSVDFVRIMNLNKIGLVENMSYYTCPHCGEKLNVFGESKGEEFAKELDIDYLGNIPLTEDISGSVDKNTINTDKDDEISKKFNSIVTEIKKNYLK